MKHVILVCQGISDESIEELTGRTPLEVAKTPHLDALASKGCLGQASFVPASLRASGDVAVMSILGFDPQEFYTGIAPLEAIAMGVPQSDHAIAFRCNLVTTLDENLIDAYSGNILSKESQVLIKEINEKLSNDRIKFYSGEGFRNLLMVNDAELAESLDDLECVPPQTVVGEKFSKNLPKGSTASVIVDLINSSKAILENHEINKVRIDLKENPANMIWPWGQGKKPKIPAFRHRYTREGCVFSDLDFLKGLSKALGLKQAKSLESAIDENDFVFAYFPWTEGKKIDMKLKIKFIEEFDSVVVGPAMKRLEKEGRYRICVTGDCFEPLSKKTAEHGHVPLLMQGAGVDADENTQFNEKSALQSKLIFEEGHKLMEYFLK